ncbi:DUF7848 domain-containing protein [Streptomyces caelestis]|uniref:DUF7848 domain-containing protein n=1 Tax=Streptomyces caelestis TaxID=36816 RepID=A0A7W9H5U4_9ACTN|nr:hypothetical protein [Streptomyces caelestis]MBB5796279.1 hypothetical protein [Streptomyces caelestis]GGW42307.1 hypothetical protein GCM10010320_22850 [Streptomyces caelestis]
MSACNGITRGRYRFAEWTLTAVPTMAVRHCGRCLTCGERSADTADADDVHVWCLKHAGLTHHSGYEFSAFQYFNATMSDPGNESHAT